MRQIIVYLKPINAHVKRSLALDIQAARNHREVIARLSPSITLRRPGMASGHSAHVVSLLFRPFTKAAHLQREVAAGWRGGLGMAIMQMCRPNAMTRPLHLSNNFRNL